MPIQDTSRFNAATVARAMAAGFAGVGVATIVLLAAYGFAAAIGQLNPVGMTGPFAGLISWFYFLAHNQLTQNTGEALVLSLGLHFTVGIIWALVYAAFFAPRMTGTGWRKGALFSLLPWILSLVVFFPLVGAGFFGFALGAGPLPAFGNLILHLAFGATLGAVYALPSFSMADDEDQRMAMAGAERGIALGLVAGVIAGVVFGLVLAGIGGSDWSPIGAVVAAGSACGALGVILGSMVGLGSTNHNAASDRGSMLRR